MTKLLFKKVWRTGRLPQKKKKYFSFHSQILEIFTFKILLKKKKVQNFILLNFIFFFLFKHLLSPQTAIE